MEKGVKGIECKFVIHIPTNNPEIPDAHLIKEVIHYTDGTSKPGIRIVENFKRPFYITKRSKRNHQDKKEWESLENLDEYNCTQSQLRDKIALALDKAYSNERIKELCASPYVYGADLSSSAIIKKMYSEKYPDMFSAYEIATFDVETDVLHGTQSIICATIAMKKHILTVVTKKFVEGVALPEEKFLQMCQNEPMVNDFLVKHKLTPKLIIVDDDLEIVKTIFSHAHEWKPDFLSIWNMNFDIPKVLETLKNHDVDPRNVLCDPDVPPKFRLCKYRQGPTKKVAASGKVKPINFWAQWHTLQLTSSFYVIDQMCSFKQIRLSKQEEASYSLDYILQKHVGTRKLKFTKADGFTGLNWHREMQSKYPIEYLVYNLWDACSMIDLDDVTNDLAFTLPLTSGISEFSDFKSQPKRFSDEFEYFVKENGYVLSTVGMKKESKNQINNDEYELIEVEENDGFNEDEENNDETLTLRGWIITLMSMMQCDGNKCIAEDPSARTGIRTLVYDADAKAAYPTGISITNMSRHTTKREIINIKGIDEEVFRLQNINCVLGVPNAIEYCTTMFNLPTPDKLLKYMD